MQQSLTRTWILAAMRTAAALTLTAVIALPCQSAAQSSRATASVKEDAAVRELIQIERDWAAAGLRHDTTTIARILADEFMGIDGRAVMSTKADEIAEARGPEPGAAPAARAILSDEFSEGRVRVYGETAVVTGVSSERISANGRETTVQYRRTTVYVRRAGRWQCVSFHASRIVPPPASPPPSSK
jgi:ketosteroid isomerase-like protein